MNDLEMEILQGAIAAVVYHNYDNGYAVLRLRCGDGQTVTVVKLHGEGAVRRRIMDMGITKNVEIYIRKVAPLGDPFELNVRGYELSLRKADAEMIEIL